MKLKIAAIFICLVMAVYGLTPGNPIPKSDEDFASESEGDESLTPVQWIVEGCDQVDYEGVDLPNDVEETHPNDPETPVSSVPEENEDTNKSLRRRNNRRLKDSNSETFENLLEKGWNMISIPFSQKETEITTVLKSIEGNYDTVQYYDASDSADPWKQYNVYKPAEMNDLTEIDHEIGFWVHMTEQDTLVVEGLQPDYTYIPLYSGWNLVGYPSLVSRSPNEASVPPSVDTIMHQNSETKAWERWSQDVPAIDTLNSLKPGEGYWVHLSENADWKVSEEIEEPEFSFPEDLSSVCGFDDLNAFFGLNDSQKALLKRNGFVGITDFRTYDDFTEAYKVLYNSYLPIFITTDSILHVYHIFFDDLLRSIEEDYLIGYSENMTIAMLKKSLQQYENVTSDLSDRAFNCVAYFSVALKLINPNATTPIFVEDIVNQELDLIKNHTGFETSPIFGYREDYSQYKPRGHYTRSKALKRYFKEMMWYGRIMYRVISDDETIQAIMIADGMQTASNNGMAADHWDTIYEITSYFVGESDDLTYMEYLSAINDVYGSLSSDYHELLDDAALETFQDEIKTMRKPSICSSFVTAEQDMVDETLGLRFMGQRYIPDSYMFQELVYNKIDEYHGTTPAFTTISVETPARGMIDVRGFPRGLDVMSILGSFKAEEILDREGDANYVNYPEQVERLKSEFSNMTHENWTQNMYWSWLYSLKSLTINFSEENYPQFMKNTAWQDEKLNTNLGSWAELRHDTILYAKQSYTMIGTTSVGASPPPPPHYEKGYVEPVPEFYQRMMDLTNTTIEGLNDFGVLSNDRNYDLLSLRNLIGKLKTISEKELENQELAYDEYNLIREIGDELVDIIGDIDEDGLKTTMIADVHSDPNTQQCLEEAVGYIDFVVIIVQMPDGSFSSMAGPIFSYYEFKQPMSDRLTDEQWEEMLKCGNQPPRPNWIGSFLP